MTNIVTVEAAKASDFRVSPNPKLARWLQAFNVERFSQPLENNDQGYRPEGNPKCATDALPVDSP